MDIRRRMLFKKKASSGGGGGSTAGGSYTVNLNSQWQLSTSKANPDSSKYEGVYESFSNYNVNSGVATMTITISGYKKFSLYIRSYAESNYDYVMVGQLDKAITGSTSYSSTDVKAHTRGNQQSGTAISNYTLVEFDNMIGGTHTITIVYRKDGSAHNNDDRGYVLISKVNESYGTIEPEEPGSGGSSGTINVGDIAYWDGSKVKTVSSDKWSTSLGTPVGVVVVPEGFAPDGKARLIGLKPADSSGNPSDSNVEIAWCAANVDTSLTNYNRVPTTDNAGSTSDGSDSSGYLPSDAFRGDQSYVDPNAKYSPYSTSSILIPSPYLGDSPNPEYYKTISGYNNVLSDFNGLSNTQTLVGLGSKYNAANAAWKYKDGSSNLQWYLPGMGELGYIMTRFNLINASLTAIGGIAVNGGYYFWSSSESLSNAAYRLYTAFGNVANTSKTGSYYVRPFATIENNNGIDTDDYLTIEALENGLTASLSVNTCEYCVNGDGNWKSLAAGTATESINSGHTLSFRGELIPNNSNGIGTFTISKKCNLKGNCMSMLFGDNAANNFSLSGKDDTFYKLFYNCNNIINVSSNFLPATTLANYCYQQMFQNCTNLITTPELPATTLANYCYYGMFVGCAKLTAVPELPATTLAGGCYRNMFEGCTSLTAVPELPATTLADYCYQQMFQNCTYLTTPPELPATTLANYCYYGMFYGCTKLTTPPELPATTLANSCYYGMFQNCTYLTTPPELPATTLANSCYYWMFYGCTSLTTTSSLPATTLANYCYYGMFYGCTSLTTTSSLPATTLASDCYDSMFYKCTSLKTAPALPATTLASDCYNGMFGGCTSLTTAPALPATTLANYCYKGMFGSCTSLTTAPELPATTLANYCYSRMFYNCTSLTTATELPATTLTTECYSYMFQKCTKLNYIKMLATDISASNCLYYWVNGVSSTGTFVKNPDMTSLPTGTSGIPSGWTVVNDEEESVNTDNYLTIEALEDGLTASLSVNACEYCVDGDGNWKTLSAGTATESINSGQTLSFRGDLNPVSYEGIGTFTISKKCNLKGNCMSMLFGDAGKDNYSLNGKDYAFYELFYCCKNIVNVSSNFLPATTLEDHCYNSMFQGCTSLTTAPELPATKLATHCYNSMFQGCTSLTTAPELPATKLATHCYDFMFHGCRSLTTAPELPAMTLADYCYYGMFQSCTGLTTAPELPATTLARSCYYYMFNSCTKLNYIKMLATDISASQCLYYWVYGVASSGTFVKNPAMNSLPTGVSGIPEGWTVVNDGEETNLITFTINSVEYQAEDGMTWEQWVNSEYSRSNTNFVYTITSNIVFMHNLLVGGDGSIVRYNSNNMQVSTNDVIQKSINYITMQSGGAD